MGGSQEGAWEANDAAPILAEIELEYEVAFVSRAEKRIQRRTYFVD